MIPLFICVHYLRSLCTFSHTISRVSSNAYDVATEPIKIPMIRAHPISIVTPPFNLILYKRYISLYLAFTEFYPCIRSNQQFH